MRYLTLKGLAALGMLLHYIKLDLDNKSKFS